MSAAPAFARRFVAGLMVLVLVLAGAGRGMAAMPMPISGSVVIAGVTIALCETGKTDDSALRHDCELCALSAPPLLPVPAGLAPARAHSRPADSLLRAFLVPAAVPGERQALPRGPPTP